MIDHANLTRRFVRTKAIQYLYAFYIHQQANFHNAINEVKTMFIPDVFSKEPADLVQLEKEKAQAIKIFTAWETSKKPHILHMVDKTMAHEVADKVWKDYQSRLTQEINLLQHSFKATLGKIIDIYLLSLQLVIEWFVIAQDQAQKSKDFAVQLSYPVALVHNRIIESLHSNGALQDLLLQRNLSWKKHMDVVARWYNQFIKGSSLLHDPLPTNKDDQDYKVLTIILEQVVMKQEDIEHFFSHLDLGWEEDKPIVKKLLKNVHTIKLSRIMQDQTLFLASSVAFYTNLISHVLERDRQIEEIVQQYTSQWAIERFVLLDRIIIKLALSEMYYFPDTPTKVIINEYVELAKKYSTLKSGAFVNGILDAIAKTV